MSCLLGKNSSEKRNEIKQKCRKHENIRIMRMRNIRRLKEFD